MRRRASVARDSARPGTAARTSAGRASRATPAPDPVSPDALPIADSRTTARTLGRMLGETPWLLAGTVLVLLAGSAAGLLVPFLLGRIVDLVTQREGIQPLLVIGAALLASTAVAAGAGWWGAVLLSRLAQRIVARLRERVFRAAIARPASVLERAGTGDLVSRVSNDVDAVTAAISGVLPSATAALFTIVLTLVGVGVLDGRFVLAFLAAVPVQVLALRWFLRRSAPVYRAERAAEAVRGQHILETVGGATTVGALRSESRHTETIATASHDAIALTLEATRIRTVFYGRLNVAEFIGLAAVLVAGYLLVTDDLVTIGAATAAALYFHNLFGPIGVLLSSVDDLQSAAAGLARLVGVLEGRPGERAASAERAGEGAGAGRPGDDAASALGEAAMTDAGARDPGAAEPGIRLVLDRVGYEYAPGRAAVRDVSLTLRAGERVAIVGSSGAGKSTLARLIAGVATPTTGAILLDGRPLTTLDESELRREIVLVSQEVHVFTGSVRDNLALTHARTSASTAADALRRTGADWVDDLPHGVDTVVGGGGVALDAARAQHLALARLVVADPGIAVLDEATAEAGSAEADVLDRAAAAALGGRASVVVVHRLSQAASADRILVMEHGSIVEEGPHDALVAAEGRYAELWSAWSAARSGR